MEIILLERVEKLGHIGDLVNVKPGYARNYLLPNGKALRANKANLEKFETERGEIAARNADQRAAAEIISSEMGELTITLVRAASEMGQLFGSVTARDIANGVAEAGYTIDKQQVVMDKAIKTLGLFPVKVNLHAEVGLMVTLNIARSLEEAKKQVASGEAVISSENRDDRPDAKATVPVVAASEEEAETGDDAKIDEVAETGDVDAETAEIEADSQETPAEEPAK